MKHFNNSYHKYLSELSIINSQAKYDSENFIKTIEKSYKKDIYDLCMEIKSMGESSKIVMLAGPSGSGKTTTAHMICKCLIENGRKAKIISMDDFFLGDDNAPLLPDGTRDYENVLALNLPELNECLLDIINKGYCDKPVFDFVNKRPKSEKVRVELDDNEIIIVEGIHALNPVITGNLPKRNIINMYISVKQGINNNDEVLLSANDIRFIRRLIRDHNFRGSGPMETLQMWENVRIGEEKYIKPFKKESDITINSIHIYEPCVLKKEAIELLKTVKSDSSFYDFSFEIINKLKKFEYIDSELVPKDSLLREFIG